MAQIQNPKAPAVTQCTVLRAICMAGERVEIGAVIEMTMAQYTEAKAAGKVGPVVVKKVKKAE